MVNGGPGGTLKPQRVGHPAGHAPRRVRFSPRAVCVLCDCRGLCRWRELSSGPQRESRRQPRPTVPMLLDLSATPPLVLASAGRVDASRPSTRAAPWSSWPELTCPCSARGRGSELPATAGVERGRRVWLGGPEARCGVSGMGVGLGLGQRVWCLWRPTC